MKKKVGLAGEKHIELPPFVSRQHSSGKKIQRVQYAFICASFKNDQSFCKNASILTLQNARDKLGMMAALFKFSCQEGLSTWMACSLLKERKPTSKQHFFFYWNTHIRDNSLEKFSKDWSSNKLDTKSSQCWTLWKQNFILTSPVTFCLLHFPPLPSSQPPIYVCIYPIFKQSKRSQKLNYCLSSKRSCVQMVDIHHLPLICQKLLSPTPAVSRV